MPKYPSEKECINILKRAGCSDEVIAHCIAVKKLALKIARLTNADISLVLAGAMLHDIGRAKTHGVAHGVEGARLAARLHLCRKIVRIIERHIGAGITAEEAKRVGLPEKNYLPVSLEEKIVCHADTLIASVRKQKLADCIRQFELIGLHSAIKRLIKLHKELSKLCNKDIDELE